MTVRLAPQPCPKCSKIIDAASIPGPQFDEPIPPVPGDLTVCLHCGAILVYAVGGPEAPWRLLDLRDWMRLDGETRFKVTFMARVARKFARGWVE